MPKRPIDSKEGRYEGKNEDKITIMHTSLVAEGNNVDVCLLTFAVRRLAAIECLDQRRRWTLVSFVVAMVPHAEQNMAPLTQDTWNQVWFV